jgi:hypothetical protein
VIRRHTPTSQNKRSKVRRWPAGPRDVIARACAPATVAHLSFDSRGSLPDGRRECCVKC